jgi:hypothetical protein
MVGFMDSSFMPLISVEICLEILCALGDSAVGVGFCVSAVDVGFGGLA